MANIMTQANGAIDDTLYFPLTSKIIIDQISGNYQRAKRVLGYFNEFVNKKEEPRIYHQIKQLEECLAQQNPL
ncbi:MAG: hypothetical protein WC755_00020 [Candidatus Woesearchaeota archaeon]|jgi:hypothetical protein